MYPPVIKHGNGKWTIYQIFLARNLHSVRGFPVSMFDYPPEGRGFPIAFARGCAAAETAPIAAKGLIRWHGQADRAHALHVAGGVKILDAGGDGCRCTAHVLQVVGAGHQNHLPRSHDFKRQMRKQLAMKKKGRNKDELRNAIT